MSTPLNSHVAAKLQEMADLLGQQEANPFRVRAYRNAAAVLERMDQDVAEIFHEKGIEGLKALPGIGAGIATAIGEMIRTGRWSQLERLRGGLDPVRLFQTVPGIGPDLARRIRDELHIDSLPALENAAHDGTLAQVRGIGPRRLMAVRAALASMLGRADRRWRLQGMAQENGPDLRTLLTVDRIYRKRAAADELPRIAPRRFNPEGRAWLPVLHTELDGWHFTALFSNSPLAHQLDRTRDWVVIYHYDDHHQEGQCTVVTETRGPLAGKRVVRGREQEQKMMHKVSA